MGGSVPSATQAPTSCPWKKIVIESAIDGARVIRSAHRAREPLRVLEAHARGAQAQERFQACLVGRGCSPDRKWAVCARSVVRLRKSRSVRRSFRPAALAGDSLPGGYPNAGELPAATGAGSFAKTVHDHDCESSRTRGSMAILWCRFVTLGPRRAGAWLDQSPRRDPARKRSARAR